MDANKRIFATCSKCGKRLIGKLDTGTWEFLFGRNKENESSFVPIHMYIRGPLMMKCISRECRQKYPDHWNLLDYFPEYDIFINRHQSDVAPIPNNKGDFKENIYETR